MKNARVLLLIPILLAVSSPGFAQTPWTPEIEVSSAEPGFDVFEFSAAMNDRGDFVVVWSSLRPAPAGILAPALFARGSRPTARRGPERSASPRSPGARTPLPRWRSRRTALSWSSITGSIRTVWNA